MMNVAEEAVNLACPFAGQKRTDGVDQPASGRTSSAAMSSSRA